jgi:aminoglycoside phosphotransferase (APT) family kinase protein
VSGGREEFEERLRAGLQRHLPGVRELLSCERLSGGASQETYRVVVRTDKGEQPIAVRRAAGGVSGLRFPGYPGLRAEALMMREARRVGVPAPEIYWIFAPADELGDGFAMQWLDGETLGARIVRAPELAEIRPRLAEQCGAVLARIHAIDLAASGLDQVLDRIPPAAFLEQTWKRYQAFDTPQPMIDFTARWLRDHLPGDSDLRLVHNDFRNGNIMVSPKGIVAVLDWELAHIGDPMRDLGWLCTNSWRFGGELPVGGFGEVADLLRGYESVSGVPVDPERVKYWQVFGSFWWAVGCLEMAEHYRSGPDKSVERPAIGRRSSECQVDCVNLLIPGPVERLPPVAPASTDMPRADELLASVAEYLRQDVMNATRGRTRFLARVAANAVDIVQRELAADPCARRRQHEQLRALLACDGTLAELEWKLVDALRNGRMPLDTPGLAAYLRDSVVHRVAIDQPRYSGLTTALSAPRHKDGDEA